MILHESPDGQSYGTYGSYGFWPIVAAFLPTIMDALNPKTPPLVAPPPPPSNTLLILGLAALGLVAAGGVAYVVLRKPSP